MDKDELLDLMRRRQTSHDRYETQRNIRGMANRDTGALIEADEFNPPKRKELKVWKSS